MIYDRKIKIKININRWSVCITINVKRTIIFIYSLFSNTIVCKQMQLNLIFFTMTTLNFILVASLKLF